MRNAWARFLRDHDDADFAEDRSLFALDIDASLYCGRPTSDWRYGVPPFFPEHLLPDELRIWFSPALRFLHPPGCTCGRPICPVPVPHSVS